MKLALVTTPPSVRSGIGDYTRHLMRYLGGHFEVTVFVDPALGDLEWEGQTVRRASDLAPRDFDQILYQLGNEQSHAYMARMIRAVGGTVVQHDWVLFDMALAAFPGLARGGPKGHALALREGGLGQARIYARNWLSRRHQRGRPARDLDPSSVEGTVLFGWHEPEEAGRWTSDRAAVRIPSVGVERIEVELHVDDGRTVRLHEGGCVRAVGGCGALEVQPGVPDQPVVVIETDGIRVTKQQREHGDNRRLGSFVRRIAWSGAEGAGELDLRTPSARPNRPVTLSRERFRLPLNRSVVRFADAFLVHSHYVRDLIVRERNAATPIGLVHHGAEVRWRDEDRRETRRRLGLSGPWLDCFLVTSFGGVQPHKRVDKALHALARARREREDVRLVLAGSLHSGEFDPSAMAERLGISDAVHFTGFVPEEEGWDWLHAGDVALNLRGPSSGGTSGGIFQAFSMSRPVIASDAAEQRELPDSCVIKVPLGDEEIPTLTRVMLGLCEDRPRLEQLELATRRFVETECHWGIVAKRYAEHLERFPPARSARKRLVSLRPT